MTIPGLKIRLQEEQALHSYLCLWMLNKCLSNKSLLYLQMEDDGRTVVKDLKILLPKSVVNRWFGTSY